MSESFIECVDLLPILTAISGVFEDKVQFKVDHYATELVYIQFRWGQKLYVIKYKFTTNLFEMDPNACGEVDIFTERFSGLESLLDFLRSEYKLAGEIGAQG